MWYHSNTYLDANLAHTQFQLSWRLPFSLCRSSVARRKAKLANMRSTAHTPAVPSACTRSCTRSCPARLSLSRRVQATLSHKVKGAAVCKRAPWLFQALSHQKETEQAAPLNPSSRRVPVTYVSCTTARLPAGTSSQSAVVPAAY